MNANAFVNYHVISDTPQSFQFDVDGIAGNLLSPELVAAEISVKDLRDRTDQVNFNDDGIRFVKASSKTKAFDNSADWQTGYDREITELLKQSIDAQEVIVFDHTVRVDDPDAIRKPARNVHNDYSSKGAQQRLIDLLGEPRAAEFERGKYAFVNVWRPVEHTIVTSPLGFIRPSTIKQEDWMTIALVYPDRLGEILGVAQNPEHQWFYQSQMTPDEVIIFNIYDNQGRPHFAHSALDMSKQVETTLPRKSIETRTLVRYN